MKQINSIKEVVCNYDYFLIDVWGVIHDGCHPYKEAIEVINYLTKQNKIVCLISNAPRRSQTLVALLIHFGIKVEKLAFIATSGELAYQKLRQNQENQFLRFGKNYFAIGKQEAGELLAGLDYKRVNFVEEADFILNIGFDPNDNLGDLDKIMIAATRLNLPMICANPDLKVVTKEGEELLCAGFIANQYQNMGSEVKYYGKPFAEIYNFILQSLSQFKDGTSSLSKILAIGDGIHTDIKGARNFGIDSLLVTGGLLSVNLKVQYHETIALEKIKQIYGSDHDFPNFVISNLKL